MSHRLLDYALRTLVVVGVTALIVSSLLLVYYAADVFLLGFAGILLAIFLRSLSDWLSAYTSLPNRWSLGIVVLALVGLTGIMAWQALPRLGDQIADMAVQIPRDLRDVRQEIEKTRWGHQAMALLPEAGRWVSTRGDFLGRITGFASTTFGAVGSLFVIFFVGLYVAYEPATYARGTIRLVPPGARHRAAEVLSRLGEVLRSWLFGRMVAMIATGVLTAIGLWALRIPFALTLGFLAGLLTLIPYIGAVLSAIPALLIALPRGTSPALYVMLLYAFVQFVEGYVITPLVQRSTNDMPPALQILVQVLFGVLTGPLGVILATPLLACAMVLTEMLYIEDLLGEQQRGTSKGQISQIDPVDNPDATSFEATVTSGDGDGRHRAGRDVETRAGRDG